MNNYATMQLHLDRRNYTQAALYTAMIAAALLLIVWFVKFYQPVVPVPPQEETIEIALPEPPPPPVNDVNLGNNDVGSGNVQPIVTGTPSSAPVSHDVSEVKSSSTQQATKDFDEDNEKSAPVITKPTKPNPAAKEINNNATDQSTTAAPQLRRGAQMTSVRGSGNGGNTDELGYNKPGSQGPGDGPGDKGTFNGNPKGTNFGVKMYPIGNQSFEDDFNENAKVAMLVEVDGSGKVTSATHTPKRSTGTATRGMIDIARRRAFQVKFSATGAPQKGTLIFDFSVR